MMTTIVHANDTPITVTVHRDGEIRELKLRLKNIYKLLTSTPLDPRSQHEMERAWSIMFKVSPETAHQELNQ